MNETNSSRRIGDHDLIRNLLRKISNSWLNTESDHQIDVCGSSAAATYH